MVGVLAMAAAAAPPPVKDYGNEVGLNISECWVWVKGDPDLGSVRGKEGSGEAPESDIVWNNCWGVSLLKDVIGS